MKRTMTMLLAAGLIVLTAGAAFAHPATPRVDRRQARQQARIHQGRAHGDLTRAEARRLRAGQRHVRRMERRARADGRVTLRERARLNRAQNRQNRAIHRLRHNARTC